jgi:hypothetical protein
VNYYLGRAPSGPVTIDILNASGSVVRSFSSAANTARAAEARPSGGEDEEGAPAFRRAAPPLRLTANVGMNRLIWDFNDANGLMLPPGQYRVRLAAGDYKDTKPLTLILDPRLAADNITTADLREQYDHNVRMHDMVTEVNDIANRVRQARTRLRGGGNADSLAKVEAIATTLFGPDEGVRYGRPGLQTQITYLAGMTTRADQRIGRDAVERYQTLRKELDAVEASVASVLGK